MNLSGPEVEIFTHDLKSILFKSKNKYPNIKQHHKTLILDCKNRKVNVITPALVFGNYLLNHNLLGEAKALFFNLRLQFPEDIRSHIGYMKVEYELGNLKFAYYAAMECEQVINKNNMQAFKSFLPEIFYNKIKMCVFLNELDEAKKHYYKLPSTIQRSYEFKTLELLIETRLDNFKKK